MTKRRWGYVVWVVALSVVFIPEILASSNEIDAHLPFTTISEVVGHLEFVSSTVEIATTALIVFALVSVLRVPPRTSSGGRTERSEDFKPHRTAGGRATFMLTPDVAKEATDFDDEKASAWFIVASLLSFILIAALTVASRAYWHDPPPKPGETNSLFHPGYVLYGSIALLWIVIPSLYAFLGGKDAPFPTLFRSLSNLEDWLHKWTRQPLGHALAWVLSFVLVWGLVFLLLHLTLYPFPDITHILNPTGQ